MCNQRCMRRNIFGATYAMVGKICTPGWNRINASENLGATMVIPVHPCGYIPISTSVVSNF